MGDQLHRTHALCAAGYTYYDVRRMIRAGALAPIRRGVYLEGGLPDDAAARHRLAVHAAMGDLGADAVVSHVLAAVLHGLPVWGIPLAPVHVTKHRPDHGRRSGSLHLHASTLRRTDVVLNNGIPVTSVARTVVDVARTGSFEQAVVVADAALATGRVDVTQLNGVLGSLARRRGVSQARQAVGFADGRAESVGESRSRVRIALAGLPAPELQWAVRDPDGRLIGRTDFAWPEHGVLGEFDGQIKYGRLLRPGQAAGDVVFAEKVREDELRGESWEMVRWTWPELSDFADVAVRWHRAHARFRTRSRSTR